MSTRRTMKLYKVTVAATIPANFEIEVKASTPEAAYNKAIERYRKGEGSYEEILDLPNLTPGRPDPGEHERHAPGVYIAEIIGNKEKQV